MVSRNLLRFARIALDSGDIELRHFFMQEWANYFGD